MGEVELNCVLLSSIVGHRGMRCLATNDLGAEIEMVLPVGFLRKLCVILGANLRSGTGEV